MKKILFISGAILLTIIWVAANITGLIYANITGSVPLVLLLSLTITAPSIFWGYYGSSLTGWVGRLKSALEDRDESQLPREVSRPEANDSPEAGYTAAGHIASRLIRLSREESLEPVAPESEKKMSAEEPREVRRVGVNLILD